MKFSPLILLLLLSQACESTRVEYRKTPAFYSRMADVQGLQGGHTADGTEIRFVQDEDRSLEGFTDHTGRTFLMREQREDGSVAFNSLIPEHVLILTLECLVNQEYELLWEELICESTKEWYEQEGGGKEAALNFFRVNRQEIAAMLTRMKSGMILREVERIRLDGGLVRLQLVKQLEHRFTFTELDTRWEDGQYVLVTIR